MATIISCSRRTDIPAFYTPWLMERLRAGYCHTLNPFGGQVYRISLHPQDVTAFTFWTRNPAPLYNHVDTFEERGYPFFISNTITGYPPAFEPHSPPIETAIKTFRRFSDRISPARMRWRYDPIVISSATPVDYHLRRFDEISAALEGYTDHCTFSFVQFYGKTTRNTGAAARKAGIRLERPDLEAQLALAQRLAEMAVARGISFNTCCDDRLIAGRVTKSRCIDPELIQAIAPSRSENLKLKSTRPDCGCAASVDIGIYDTCRFDCVYCYATSHPSAAQERHTAHDPRDSILWRPAALQGKNLDELAVPLKGMG